MDPGNPAKYRKWSDIQDPGHGTKDGQGLMDQTPHHTTLIAQ
jgi:hypothetical protein